MNVPTNIFGSPEGEPSITTRPMPHQKCEKVWTLPGSERRAGTALQLSFYLRPLSVHDAEVDRIPHATRPCDYVLAKRTLFPGSDTQNGFARLIIQGVGLLLHSKAVPIFKCVAQHQVLGFGVYCRSLPLRRDPSGADLHAPIWRIHIHESRAAHDLSGLFEDRGESHRSSLLLLSQNPVYVPTEIIHCSHRPGKPSKHIFRHFLNGVPKESDVFASNRLQANHFTR